MSVSWEKWARAAEQGLEDLISWAEQRYEEEVRHRPEGNIHKRALHNTWTQVITKLRKAAGS